MNFRWASPYESAGPCTQGPEPGARHLLAYLLETFALSYSGGIYNCRNVAGSQARSTHGEGRSVDLMFPLVGGRANPQGDEVLALLGPWGAALGIQCIIWNRRIYSASNPQGRDYRGVHPHTDHLHIEMIRAAAAVMTLATFRHYLGAEESDMVQRNATGDNVRVVQRAINDWRDYAALRWPGRFDAQHLAEDGQYGPVTAGAVSAMKRVLDYDTDDGDVADAFFLACLQNHARKVQQQVHSFKASVDAHPEA